MNCYYIECNFRNDDHYACSEARMEYGVWLDEKDAQAEADRLNQPIKTAWEVEAKSERAEVNRKQRRWDALHKAKLSEGHRPELDAYYTQPWTPSISDSYFSVSAIEIHGREKHET